MLQKEGKTKRRREGEYEETTMKRSSKLVNAIRVIVYRRLSHRVYGEHDAMCKAATLTRSDGDGEGTGH
jgi:hypothetical protein